MTYFINFPKVNYYFGDEQSPVRFQQLNAYVDLIDQIKHQFGFYRKHYIDTNERPDTLSYRLYNTSEYHWTFFLVNDNIRLSGWPFPDFELYNVARKKYPNTALRTKDYATLLENFIVGDIVKLPSGESRTVVSRDLNIGQIVINGSISEDNTGKIAVLGNDKASFLIESQVSEELAVHHYTDQEGNWVDIDPRIDVPEGLLPVTNISYLTDYNESLRTINIIKPDTINRVVSEFNRKLLN